MIRLPCGEEIVTFRTDGQTDGRTDRQTEFLYQYRAVLTRDK